MRTVAESFKNVVFIMIMQFKYGYFFLAIIRIMHDALCFTLK